jgi:hypothetical protein
VSASAALKANAEARAVIANGFQLWFTCELLSLEQQVQNPSDTHAQFPAWISRLLRPCRSRCRRVQWHAMAVHAEG